MSADRASSQERQTELQVARKVWDDLANETKRQDFSHYRGVGRYADEVAWRAVGESSLARLRRLVPVQFWTRPLRALEWGPGGGSNISALCRVSQTVWGVDISQKNLEECARVLPQETRDRFRAVHLQDDLGQVRKAVTEPLDIFLSTAVFQHFPSKAFGRDVLHLASDLMRDGAIGLIQIRYDNGAEKYRPNSGLDEYAGRFITATSYAIDEFAQMLSEAGFDDISAYDFNPKINYVSFSFKRR